MEPGALNQGPNVFGVDLRPSPCTNLAITPVTWYLVQFTDEIIGQIASHAGLNGLIGLLKCGSSILSFKLSSKYCILNVWHNKKVKDLPPLLKSLKGLVGMSFLGDCTELSVKWSDFPRPLHKFHCDSVSVMQFQLLADELADFSELDYFSFSWSHTDRALQSNKAGFNAILGKSLSRMSKLRVLKMGNQSPPLPGHLPPTLKELQYGIVNLQFQRLVPRLSSLTKLSLKETFRIYVPERVSAFPALITLEIPNASIGHANLGDPLQKPSYSAENVFLSSFPSLTELSTSHRLISYISIDNSNVPAFWDNLKVLRISGKVTKRFPIPPSVTFFSAELGQIRYPEYLPRSIRYLELPHTQILCKSLNNFPPLLLKLSIEFNELENIDSKIDLPNLTNLELLGHSGYFIDVDKLVPLLPPSLSLLDCRHHTSYLWKVFRVPGTGGSQLISPLQVSESDSIKLMPYFRIWGADPTPEDYIGAIHDAIKSLKPPKDISSLSRHLNIPNILDINFECILNRTDRLEVCQALFEGRKIRPNSTCRLHYSRGFQNVLTLESASFRTCDYRLLDYLLSVGLLKVDNVWDPLWRDKWPELVGWLTSRGLVTTRTCIELLVRRLSWHPREFTYEMVSKSLKLISSKDPSCFQQESFDSVIKNREGQFDRLVQVLELVFPIFRNVVPDLNLSNIFVNFLDKLYVKIGNYQVSPRKALCEPFSETTLIWFNDNGVELLLHSCDNGFNVIHAAIAVGSSRLLSLMSTKNASLFSKTFNGTICDSAGTSGTRKMMESPFEFAKLWGDLQILSHLQSLPSFQSTTSLFDPQGVPKLEPTEKEMNSLEPSSLRWTSSDLDSLPSPQSTTSPLDPQWITKLEPTDNEKNLPEPPTQKSTSTVPGSCETPSTMFRTPHWTHSTGSPKKSDLGARTHFKNSPTVSSFRTRPKRTKNVSSMLTDERKR